VKNKKVSQKPKKTVSKAKPQDSLKPKPKTVTESVRKSGKLTTADRKLKREAEGITHVVWPGVIERYRPFLPVDDNSPVVTLKEGGTPLIPSRVLHEKLGPGVRVFFKCEGLNPTGSFKDRGMTLAVTKAKEEGAQAVICASTGNTSASAAAYATTR